MNNNDLNGINLNNSDSNLNNTNANLGANSSVSQEPNPININNTDPVMMDNQMPNVGVNPNMNEDLNNNFNQPLVNNADMTPETPKKSKSGIIIAVVAVIVVLLGTLAGLLVYKHVVMSNPVTIIEKALTTFGKEAETAIKEFNAELKKIKSDKVQNEISLEINNNNTFDLVTKVDMENKVVAAKLDAALEGVDFLNVEGVLNEDAAYFSLLKDSLNSYVYYDDFKEVFEIYDDVEELDPVLANLFTYLGKSFEETITKEDFVESEEKIALDEKEVSVKKYTLTINEDTFNPFIDNYKEKVINDDALITYLTKLANTYDDSKDEYTNSDIKEGISVTIDDMKLSSEDDELKLSMYVKGTDLVKIDFGPDEDNKFEIYLNDGVDLKLLSDDEKVLTLIYKENLLKLEMHMDGTEVAFDLENEKYELSYNDGYDEYFVSGELKATETTFELTFNTEIEGTKINGSLETKESHPEDLKIEIPTNALDVSDANTEIILQQELESMPLYTLIESLMGTSYDDMYTDDYDYDYDYDSEWEF